MILSEQRAGVVTRAAGWRGCSSGICGDVRTGTLYWGTKDGGNEHCAISGASAGGCVYVSKGAIK